MAWLKRRKEKADSGRTPNDYVESNRAGQSGPRFWLDHGFEDGDRVECAVCGKLLVVKLIENKPVTLSVRGALSKSPLICGDCGRMFCEECSLRRDSYLPSCDRCQRVGGVTPLMK